MVATHWQWWRWSILIDFIFIGQLLFKYKNKKNGSFSESQNEKSLRVFLSEHLIQNILLFDENRCMYTILCYKNLGASTLLQMIKHHEIYSRLNLKTSFNLYHS